MKKQMKLLTTIIASFSLLTACSTGAKTEESINNENEKLAVSGKELNLGILPAESAIPMILAEENGYFDELGLNVNIKAFSSPNDRNVAVQAGEVDATIGDVMTAAAFVQNGINMKITSDISEDFKILSSPNSGITSIEQLSDKKVSLVPNFLLEYIMDEFADKDNFKYEIVEIASFSGRFEALLQDQIDGVVFTEPQASMLVAQGAHLLGSSKELSLKGGTVLFSDEVVNDRAGDIVAFYKAYNKAIDYMNGSDASEYASVLTNYQFPDAISTYLDTISMFEYAGEISKEQFNDIIEWSKEKGQIKDTFKYEDLTNFSYIK